MDLNFQYARHQHALMRATAATCSNRRFSLLGDAARIARSIATYQHQLGADAAAGWGQAA
jgi:hypothetical protein